MRYVSILALALAFTQAGCRTDNQEALQQQQSLNEQKQRLLAEEAHLAEQQRLAAEAEAARQQAVVIEQQRQHQAVQSAMEADARLFNTPNITLAATVQGVNAVDISACPPDFRAAYVDFESSLETLQQTTAQRQRLNSDDNAGTVLGETFLSLLVNKNAQPLQDALQRDTQLQNQEQDAQAQVLQKVRALQKVATTYGVT